MLVQLLVKSILLQLLVKSILAWSEGAAAAVVAPGSLREKAAANWCSHHARILARSFPRFFFAVRSRPARPPLTAGGGGDDRARRRIENGALKFACARRYGCAALTFTARLSVLGSRDGGSRDHAGSIVIIETSNVSILK
jgi:hypothetical protein